MDETLNKTTLTTISLLEARLLRIEHLLFGTSTPPPRAPDTAVAVALSDIERRFANLLSRVRVYAELLKICTHQIDPWSIATFPLTHQLLGNQHPTLFSPTPATNASVLPTQLDLDAIRSTVLSFATSFPSTASALTAATSESDSPVPDTAASAQLAALIPRLTGVEAVQVAQEAEIAALRIRSERVLRQYYEERVLAYGEWVASMEGTFEKVEARARRAIKTRKGELEA